MSEVLSATNLKFLAQGLWTTLYLSFFIIVLSTFSEPFLRSCVTAKILFFVG